MKIAIVDQPFGNIILPWTGMGGSIDIWIYEVARRLARSCDVVVYTKRGRRQKKTELAEGVRYRRISTAFDEWNPYLSSALDRLDRFHWTRALGHNARRAFFFRNVKRPLFASSLYYLTYALQVARDLRKEKCDTVHLFNFSQFAPIIRAHNPNIKITLHMHCEWLTQLDRAMIESRLRTVDLVIGCSQYNTKRNRLVFPQFAKRFQTLYNGVDLNHFVSKNDQTVTKEYGVRRLLCVGRVSPEKGLHILLDAFHRVVKRFPQGQLEICGPHGSLPIEFIAALSDVDKISNLTSFYRGDSRQGYMAHLQKQLLSLNISKNVIFTGFIPYTQVARNYRSADVFVNSSLSESFPLPILEAMASGLPVIATRVGGIPEAVVNGKTGLLVEPGNAAALAEAIFQLLEDEDLRISMGTAARKRAVEMFSWDRVTRTLLHLYQNACDLHDRSFSGTSLRQFLRPAVSPLNNE